MVGTTYDKERFSVNLARLKKGSEKFEVVINSDQAILFKQGKGPIKDALVNEQIFSDAKKGMVASEKLMQGYFKTTDVLKVAEVIIKQGQIQLTKEYRKMNTERWLHECYYIRYSCHWKWHIWLCCSVTSCGK